MRGIFEAGLVQEVREKYARQGYDGIDTKDILVITAAYFNDEIDAVRRGLWFLGYSVLGGIIAGIVLRILRII